MCTHLYTRTNIAADTYQGTVFICASSPSCLPSRPVSYTLKSMQNSFESIYKPSVLTLSFSPSSFAARFNVPSLCLWRLCLKKKPRCFQRCPHRTVTHFLWTWEILGRLECFSPSLSLSLEIAGSGWCVHEGYKERESGDWSTEQEGGNKLTSWRRTGRQRPWQREILGQYSSSTSIFIWIYIRGGNGNKKNVMTKRKN